MFFPSPYGCGFENLFGDRHLCALAQAGIVGAAVRICIWFWLDNSGRTDAPRNGQF